MFYSKLFLVVLLGSVGIWFAVHRFVLSTDQMAESYTANDFVPLDRDRDRDEEETELEQLYPTGLQQERGLDALTIDNYAENTADPEQSGPGTKAQIEPELIIEEDPVEEAAEKLRADSDADIQADNENVGESENTREFKDSQGEALQLDKKLLDTIESSVKIKKSIKTTDDTVRALDLAYALPKGSNCIKPDDNYPRVGVHYRPTSFAIKGQSLTNIDKLIALHKKCGGKLLILENKVDTDESDQHLIQLRQDEVKYYLLQRRVPKADMIFSD